MYGYTAEEFRTAARIAREAGGAIVPGYAETLERRAEQMERLAVTGMGILERVQVRATHHPSQERYGITPEDYGMCLVAELLAEGWTPPEELRVG